MITTIIIIPTTSTKYNHQAGELYLDQIEFNRNRKIQTTSVVSGCFAVNLPLLGAGVVDI